MAKIILGDKGLAGQEFEQIVASQHGPDRKHEQPRFGKLGQIRQWIEPILPDRQSPLSPEDHGGHIP